MSDLLSVGAAGVRAYQVALTTTSENIANTGTVGYSRRTTNLKEVTSASSGLTGSNLQNGSGVIASGVTRSADQFREAAVRDSGADLARTSASATWLERIESSLTDNKLGDRLTSFFTAARTLAADPTSVPQRATLLEAAGSAADAITATGQALSRAATDVETSTGQAVSSLNNLIGGLAQVNESMGRAKAGSAAAAQLADQRDQILSQMSAITDVNVAIDTVGRASVRLGGSTGPVAIAGTYTGRVSYRTNAEGEIALSIQRAGTESAVTPTGGALAGLVDGAQRIAAAQTSLNGLAKTFVDDVNAVQTGGDDLDGQPGTDLFASGTPASRMSVVLTDPRGIAAAATGAGPRDTTNLAALEAVRKGSGFEAKVTSLTTSNAAQLQQKKLVADAQTAIRDGAIAARDQVSGVDLDTEAVELMRFQQAYQASARVIQVAKETMQYLLDIR